MTFDPTFDPGLSVVHLCMRKGKTKLAVGTGVIYERLSQLYIATAWHNLSGRHSETLKPLSPTSGLPDNVVATIGLAVRSAQSSGSIRMPFTIPLETNVETTYFVHPKGWPRADVAVLPIFPDREYDMELRPMGGEAFTRAGTMRQAGAGATPAVDPQPMQQFAGAFNQVGVPPDALIDAGAELFVLGYPRGITDFTSAPIWKRATVASNPHIGWEKQPKFLIDCASREGMSGAPVVAVSRSGTVRVGGMRYMGSGPAAALHGIYVGRLFDEKTPKEDRLFEAQIGTVWKRAVIDEIIDAKVLGMHSASIGGLQKDIEGVIKEEWPVEPRYYEDVIANEDYQWGMTHAVMEKLNGNANPCDVRDLVIAHANKLRDDAGAHDLPKC